MRSGVDALRLVLALVLLTALAACGGGSVMNSFNGERDRVRGAMSGEVTCVERPEGPVLECSGMSGAFVLWLQGKPQGGLELSVKFEGSGSNAERAANELLKVVALYGIDRDEVSKCLNEQSYREQGPTYLATCSGASGRGAVVTVRPSKPV